MRAGTGLGLAISRGFVEAMHGTITAANRTDRPGAAFTITLPVPTPQTISARPPHERRARSRSWSSTTSRRFASCCAWGLTAQGYEVLDAPNGKAALELLAKKPDLMILDLGLPDIDGLELLRRFATSDESLPIVVLSSRGDEAGKVAALDLGADDYVTKPFGMDELLARMRAALRHQLQAHGERPVFQLGS